MKRIVTALVAATSLAAAAVAVPGTAEARWGGWGGGGWHGGGGGWHGGGFGRGWGYGGGAAVLGGLAIGAIAGAALATPYYYPPPPVYYGYSPYPNFGQGCAWQVIWNGYGWVRACI